jgi:hypothetical protein
MDPLQRSTEQESFHMPRDSGTIVADRFKSPASPNSRARGVHATRRRNPMLWTIFVILLVLWLLGMVTSYTLGGFIHVLLVIAIVVVLIRVIQGRKVV